ncbi:MAG: flavin reductase family protein [Burkholderiales bacterium]
MLAVPGERLAEVALFCGIQSGKTLDKVKACGLATIESKQVSVPGIQESIANIEMQIVHKIRSGDHMVVIGKVLKFGVDRAKNERCLLSVGPRYDGYEILARHGIHRIGVERA